MALWHTIALWVFHALFNLSEIIIAVCHILSVELKQCDTDELLPRAKLPAHLAVAFTTGGKEKTTRQEGDDDEELAESMLESANNVMHWCGHVGISTLTFYDRRGLLKSRLRELHATPQTLIPADAQDVIKAAGQATALPLRRNEEQLTSVPPKPHECLTPPTSDDSASTSIVDGAELADEVYSFTFFGMRPSGALETKDEYALAFKKDRDQSSAAKKRRPLPGDSIPTITSGSSRIRVNVISEANGIPAIVQAARELALTRTRSPSEPAPPVTVQQIDDMIHGELPPPEFLVLHYMEHPSVIRKLQPRAMDMFPPWQLRLTEIHFCAPRYVVPGLFGFPSGGSKYPLLTKKVFAGALEEYSKSVAREGK